MTTSPHLHRGAHHDVGRIQHHPEAKGRNRTVSAPRMAIERELGRVRANGGAGLTPQRLASMTGVELKTVRRILQALRTHHAAVNVGTERAPLWRLSDPGAHVQTPPTTRVTNSTSGGPYEPTELRPFDGRPGAMDAFLLPSMVNGQRVPARRITAQCVGALPDRETLAR